jgi:hypothetical protein
MTLLKTVIISPEITLARFLFYPFNKENFEIHLSPIDSLFNPVFETPPVAYSLETTTSEKLQQVVDLVFKITMGL